MKVLFAILTIGLSLIAALPLAAQVPCLAGKQKALIEGHFSGPVICSPRDATFALVGQTSGNGFSIYDYRFRFLPQGGNVMHGGQRIVVFQHGRYLGQYMLSPPPFSTLTVDGSHVVVTKMGHLENDVLDFSAGPAKEAFLDGQIEQFAR